MGNGRKNHNADQTKKHTPTPTNNTFLYIALSIIPALSVALYHFFLLTPAASTPANTQVSPPRSTPPPPPLLPSEWLPIPFVPCACSVPTATTKRKDATLECSVTHDHTDSGGASLSSKPMVVDGLQTIKNYVPQHEQEAIISELQQYPFVPYSGKSCQEFGQNFSFYIDSSTADYLPPAVKALGDRLVSDGLLTPEERPNYVLVNRYTPGEGIHAHVDDNYYTDGIVSVTLMSGGSLNFFRDTKNVYFEEHPEIAHKYTDDSLLECGAGYFEPGSLFAMHREGRYAYKHEMKRRLSDRVAFAKLTKKKEMKVWRVRHLKRRERIAITFRHVKGEVVEAKHRGSRVEASSAYGGRL
jgi:hypothetical protein